MTIDNLTILVVEDWPTNGTDFALVCHFHKGELLFHNNNLTVGDGTCFPFYKDPEGITEQTIKTLAVNPMPVTGTSVIQTEGIRGVPKMLYIYNTTGQLVQTQNLNSNAPIVLHKHDFKAGMYSLLFITQNQQYYKGKFIVTRNPHVAVRLF